MEQFQDSPLTQSSSPSDFWGNRWDRPIQSALRRGCFKPLRKAGYSRAIAALLTFVVSGFMHEYILYSFTIRKRVGNNNIPLYEPAFGTQFIFFSWNAIILLVERALEGHAILQWMQQHLPKPIRTALVLLTVLPIAHLFTDEYIRSNFYNDAAWGFPIIVYLGEEG